MTTTKATKWIAVIATDGIRPVIWGIGTTDDAALTDAQRWAGFSSTEEYWFAPITHARVRAVRRGDIDASDL